MSPGPLHLPAAELFGRSALDWGVVAVFAVVYLGMFLGGLPRLKLDRSGVALLGAIAVIAFTGESVEDAARAVDLPTIVLLFAFMVVSAQMRLGGFYTAVTQRVAALPLSRSALLAVLIAVAGALSAVFSNDIVCLAMTPVVARLCLRRGLPPLPFLVGLACAANIGSAATLIGNPQNMLIGQTLALPFNAYLAYAALPTVLGLVVVWGVIAWQQRGDWRAPAGAADVASRARDDVAPFDAWQTAKGLAVAAALLLVFVATSWPREVAALAGAGALLLSRRLHSRDKLGLVDWPLLVLFLGLFVVNGAFAETGIAAEAVAALRDRGVDLAQPRSLILATVALSNLVSNVPAVMLLLPHVQAPAGGPLLALASTLAGNLLLVGSIANLIVVDAASRHGIPIDWRRHARTGVPITLLTLAILALGTLLA